MQRDRGGNKWEKEIENRLEEYKIFMGYGLFGQFTFKVQLKFELW